MPKLRAEPAGSSWWHTRLLAGPQVICTKVRDGAKRIVRLKEGEPRGKHVVIVDDLVQSGGTLIECQKLLAAQVHLCVQHLLRRYPSAGSHMGCCNKAKA
jgi:Phosphoribosyl transferase domain